MEISRAGTYYQTYRASCAASSKTSDRVILRAPLLGKRLHAGNRPIRGFRHLSCMRIPLVHCRKHVCLTLRTRTLAEVCIRNIAMVSGVRYYVYPLQCLVLMCRNRLLRTSGYKSADRDLSATHATSFSSDHGRTSMEYFRMVGRVNAPGARGLLRGEI